MNSGRQCVSTFIQRTETRKKKEYYLAISDRPNFPSPFRSNILSYKVEAEYRQKGSEENDSQERDFLTQQLSEKVKLCPINFTD